jgi:hypothetical protein
MPRWPSTNGGRRRVGNAQFPGAMCIACKTPRSALVRFLRRVSKMDIAARIGRGGKLKAYCLAFAFLLGSLPAVADELPQSSNASRASEADLAQPGSFHWTVIDDAAGAGAQVATGQTARSKDAPARAALAQMRAETARIFAEARRVSAKIERIRYELRVRCVVEQAPSETDPLASVSMPWIWGAPDAAGEQEGATVEMCEVDYSQRVRGQTAEQPDQVELEPAPDQMRDYAVSFPVQ